MKSKNNDLVTQIFLAVVGVIFAGMIIYYVMNSIKVTSRLADTVLSSAEGTASEYAEIEITTMMVKRLKEQRLLIYQEATRITIHLRLLLYM